MQDLFLTETARYADVVLPGASFAEKTGTVVNTERRIQLMHKAIDPPGDARGDLEILIELSNRIGLPTPFANSAEVMDEIARVTPSWRGVSHARLARRRTAVSGGGRASSGNGLPLRRPLSDGGWKGDCSSRVEFLPPAELPDEEFPFFMNTGRQMYHWHTGTMTRRSHGLDAREPTPIGRAESG